MKTAFLLLIATTIIASAQVRQAWVVQQNLAPLDGAVDMALDGAGNAYVLVATSQFFQLIQGYVVLKFDPSGKQLWSAPSNPQQLSVAVDMALDGAGNVYVTGYGEGVEGLECETAKFSPAGEQLWVARYNGPGQPQFHERGTAIAVDRQGNVYVGGNEGDPRDVNFLVLKYDFGQQGQAHRHGTRHW